MPVLIDMAIGSSRLRAYVVSVIAAAAACALTVVPAEAQVVNPNLAEFNPSSDHNTVLSDGSAAVQSYKLGLYLTGAAAPFQEFSLGKPSPDPDGFIRVNLATLFIPLPTPGINYTADVAAIGPGGVGRSAPSGVFSFAVTG